ncbi:MAG: TonB-dependent receptor [Bacteroidota bacterium]
MNLPNFKQFIPKIFKVPLFLALLVGSTTVANNRALKSETGPFHILDENPRSISSSKFQEVSGKVMNDERVPLPGATILEKGTSNGVTTDFDGNFTISLTTSQPTLIVSYLGYITQEYNVGTSTFHTIILQEDSARLDEVVVIGYGTQKRSDLTGAISSLGAATIDEQPVTKVADILQGRLPGVTSNLASGRPGSNRVIRIRGANSINASNEPLVVIDGLIGADITALNPNNIQSIEVLKDASSTAIYGSRGANGVIIITTKTGRAGDRASIRLNQFTSFQSVPNNVSVLDGLGYIDAANTRRTIGNYSRFTGDLNDFNYPTQEQILNTVDGNGNRIFTWNYYFPEAIAATANGDLEIDWQDEIFRTAVIQNYDLSISGGSEKITYNISGNYLDQEGVVINSDFRRFGIRGNFDIQATDKLKIGLNVLTTREEDRPVGEGSKDVRGVVSAALFALPVGLGVRYPDDPNAFPDFPFDPALVGAYFNQADSYANFGDSSPNSGSRLWNPVAAALEPEREINTNRNSVNAYLEYAFTPKLSFRVFGGAIFENQENKNYFNEFIQSRSRQGIRNADLTRLERNFYQNSNILTYTDQFGDHGLVLTGVLEQQFERNTGFSIAVEGFPNNNTGFDAIQSADIVNSRSSFATERYLLSYMGRASYSYKDKYLLTGTFRADGSSVFGSGNKWAYFPSIGLGWRVSNEKFLEDNNTVSSLKLRTSYGVSGNQAIQPYQTLPTLTSGGTALDYPVGGSSLVVGSTFNRLGNPDLKWERTSQFDIGFDLQLWNGRLDLTADYYFKSTKDLLLERSLATQTGFSSVLDNVGIVENKGVEIALNGILVDKEDFSIDAGINVTFNKNEVVELSNPDEERIQVPVGNVMFLQKGRPLGSFYGYQYLGVWKLGEEAEAARFGQIPGTAKIVDQNNDGVYDANDKVFLGSAIPETTFGFNTNIRYKNFTLSTLLTGSLDYEIFNAGALERFDFENTGTTGYRGRDRWHPTLNPDGFYQRYDFTSTINTSEARQNATNILTRKDAWESDIFIEDGSFVRLSNVTLAYSFPQDWLRRSLGISAARIYLSGQNLKVWTDYTGYDPELSASPNDALDNTGGTNGVTGYELNGYPIPRTYTLGIDLTF